MFKSLVCSTSISILFILLTRSLFNTYSIFIVVVSELPIEKEERKRRHDESKLEKGKKSIQYQLGFDDQYPSFIENSLNSNSYCCRTVIRIVLFMYITSFKNRKIADESTLTISKRFLEPVFKFNFIFKRSYKSVYLSVLKEQFHCFFIA